VSEGPSRPEGPLGPEVRSVPEKPPRSERVRKALRVQKAILARRALRDPITRDYLSNLEAKGQCSELYPKAAQNRACGFAANEFWRNGGCFF
jgi:hypothetical protein